MKKSPNKPATLLSRFYQLSQTCPNQKIYTFVNERGEEQASLTYREVLFSTNSIANYLLQQAKLAPRSHILLVYSPSLAFVEAFIGCLHAGLIPVPISPPDPHRLEHDLKGFAATAKNCQAVAILTNKEYFQVYAQSRSHPQLDWSSLPWHITDDIPAQPDFIPSYQAKPKDVAFIQYTSGSTSAPKGVLITHSNIAHQLNANAKELGLHLDSRSVVWIPHYHDFCLISGILSALWGNGSLLLMSPLTFLRRPAIWFDILSRTKATHTAAPNFAYELALAKTSNEERLNWDLSSIEIMMSAAEPIVYESMQKFFNEFSVTGLRSEAFCPAYGLAEHAVGVTVKGRGIVHISRDDLEKFNKAILIEHDEEIKTQGGIAVITGCGRPAKDIVVRIVDPETCCPLKEGQVGEIWVNSPSKAAGYLGFPKETAATFRAKLANNNKQEFLRTGDLGFLLKKELYVTGRCKELIIIHGRNIYPQDLEQTVRHCHQLVRPDGIVGFALEASSEAGEQLVIMAELTIDEISPSQGTLITDTIAKAVTKNHGVSCNIIWLGRGGALPRTPNGKLQRTLCRTLFAAHQFEQAALYIMHQWTSNNKFKRDEVDTTQINGSHRLHPLLDLNTSTLKEQRFKTTLSAEHFYLRDHVILNEKVLPGVAYLEMARIAAALSQAENDVVGFQQVVWISPLKVNTQQEITISLHLTEQGKVRYEIKNGQDPNLLYSQGVIVYGNNLHKKSANIEVSALQADLPQTLDSKVIYETFKDYGFQYGPGFQALRWIKSDGVKKALGYIVLPDTIKSAADRSQYGLHPSLLDGALQVIFGLQLAKGNSKENTIYLPFGIEEVEIVSPLADKCYVIVEKIKEHKSEQCYDLRIVDENGAVQATIKNFSIRAIPQSFLAKAQQTSQTKLKKTSASMQNLLDQTYAQVIAIFAKVLNLQPADISIDSNLSEYGLDSIKMIELLHEFEAYFAKTISPNVLNDYSTIKKLVGYLIEENLDKDLPSLSTVTAPLKKGARFTTTVPKKREDKIAVIGMAGKFPQSPTLETFWQNLLTGKELIKEIPTHRWNLAGYYDPNKQAAHKSYSKWAGYLDDIEYFAADYFKAKPENAIMMDPPQRLLLELSKELLERAGYQREEIAGSATGVFIGGGASEYLHYYANKIQDSWRAHSVVNQIQNMQAARIADFYNLKGPAYIIDTACSSALVAVHQACQSLLSGESQLAIAGGAEILIGPSAHVGFSKASVLSDDGKSYVFDERAKGFVLGEGAGLVLLKPYEQAITDGDTIIGTILSSAINNDGHTMGITVPSLAGQKQVIEQVMTKHAINPESITYYEAHGTGTLLGDPIEIKAMSEIYRNYTQLNNYCAVGSVKSNVGHLMRAAGIASLIKILLCLQNRMLVPTLNCEKPHPRFQFEQSPFYPLTQAKAWDLHHGTRRAAISSFGFGGTNCHMVVEQTPENYQPKRAPLPIAPLKRGYYWLAEQVAHEKQNFYEELLTTFELNKDKDEETLSLLNELIKEDN